MPTPSRWIDIYSKGNMAFDWTLTSNATFVHASAYHGHIDPQANNSDTRVYLTIDWSAAPPGATVQNITIQIPDAGDLTYGTQYSAPIVLVPTNNTVAPAGYHGFVESDATVVIEPEHWTTVSNSPTANLTVIPGFGHTLSGVTLLPATAPVHDPASAPRMSFDFLTFTTPPSGKAGITVSMGDSLNTDTNNPMQYAIAVDDEQPQIVQPVPTTELGVFPPMWSNMVINALMTNTTSHSLPAGQHTLNVWALTPGLVFEKMWVNLGGVRTSYLGPPESVRI